MKIAEVFKILKGPIQIERVKCMSTGFSVEGPFTTPALYQIDGDHLHLVELLVIHGGNLKKVAVELDISYPTLKNRLDQIAEIIEAEHKKSCDKRMAILEDIEKGKLNPEMAAREIEKI